METKQAIRKEILRRRREADPEKIITDSSKICQTLCSLDAFKKSQWVYLYIDCKKEVMTGEIMAEALRCKKRIAAPKVIGSDMIFYEITSEQDLEPGYFGIREPREGLAVAGTDSVFLVMPGVAFDRHRHRAGYGGGFYDRYLSTHPDFYKAAVAFEFQMVEEVPTEPTDICPDIVITENRIYLLS